MKVDLKKFQWIREPKNWKIEDDKLIIQTESHTDLWQNTYYLFCNDNAPCFQIETSEEYFSFVVKTSFKGAKHRFDQCGVIIYLDSKNWLKGSIEFENNEFEHLGSVVTNDGFSDWATTNIDASIKEMWYRLSRRGSDYKLECSIDGINFKQMRITHLNKGNGKISFGVYACSPEDSSFEAIFADFDLGECKWLAHDGQKPDDLN